MLPLTDKTISSSQAIIRLLAVVAVLFAATVALGKISLLGPVKSIDEPLFDFLVAALQDIPGLVRFSERATRFGAIPVTYGMMIGSALFVALQRRRIEVPILMVLSLFGAHLFQRLVNVVVDGTIPAGSDVIGSAGPFFSGGVQRVIVVVGVLVTLAQPAAGWSNRAVFRIVLGAGVFEALTRLVLGRHWPFDLVAAFPIGFTILWIFRGALDVMDPPAQPSTNPTEEYL